MVEKIQQKHVGFSRWHCARTESQHSTGVGEPLFRVIADGNWMEMGNAFLHFPIHVHIHCHSMRFWRVCLQAEDEEKFACLHQLPGRHVDADRENWGYQGLTRPGNQR